MLHFRPLPVFTGVSTLMLAVLISLGVWQLERLQWKLGLIAQVNRNLAAAPVSLDTILTMGDDAQYHRVALSGHFDNAKEAYVFATGPDGSPVYHVLTPFEAGSGRILIVDRGIVPAALLDPKRRTPIEGEYSLVGVWRLPDAPGVFTPPPDAARRIWYSRDVNAIASADRVKLAVPVVVEADAAPNPGGWPLGGQTQVVFRNDHLQYAITWFGLAAALLGVYLTFHISKGRLG
jgi:surfeit locus 1 family protein